VGVRGAAFFDTAIGRCGIVWSDRGVVGVQLPERAGTERARLLGRFPDAAVGEPSAAVSDAVRRIVAHLRGESADLGTVALDLREATDFDCRVYEAARRIPRGETRTYGEIAAEIGEPGAAQAVGQALGRNPCPIVVPCHRVVAAAGRPGGFSAYGGVTTKLRLLAIEGAPGNAEFEF
jgi:methylated-DNA-[protein]-cysteine S-methyltransferase